jgi:hypothetical protein
MYCGYVGCVFGVLQRLFKRLFCHPGTPVVRPWALAGPVLILMLAAPLLRPLISPGVSSARETGALVSVRTVLQHYTLALPPGERAGDYIFVRGDGQIFSKEPPAFIILLSCVAWCITAVGGVGINTNPHLFEYLLIYFSITVPTALACGLLYKMGRAFELKRAWRMMLALLCVLGTGWFSYAVVLLPHALATSLGVAAMASAFHVAFAKRPKLALGWLAGGGFCAALAAVIEPASLFLLPVLTLMTIFCLPVKWPWRGMGLLLVCSGAASPLALHMTLNSQMTGDYFPPRWHGTAVINPSAQQITTTRAYVADDMDTVPRSFWLRFGAGAERAMTLLVGRHGILSHFPVIFLGILGGGMVLTRHWPGVLKLLAGTAICVLVLLILYKSFTRLDDIDANFAAPRLLIVSPFLMLCGGAWIRRGHLPVVWTFAGIAAGISILISFIGATRPAPPGGYHHYTAAEVIEQSIRLDKP